MENEDSIIGIKINTTNIPAKCIMIIRKYQNIPISEIKQKIENNQYIHIIVKFFYKIGGKKKMDVCTLRKKLKKAGVPDFLYNLDNKGRDDERFCLEHKDGKWNVYYSERGVKTTNMFFETEFEACEYIYDQLVNG